MQNNTELVSVIMPAYNAGEFIEEAISSVLSQTFSDWELIIIDDCSTDETFEIANAYSQKDKRIRIIRNTQQMGVAQTRNIGIDNSFGRYIAFLDSDDIWNPAKLQRQIEFMKNTNAALTYGDYERINVAGKLIGEVMAPQKIDYQHMLKQNSIGHLTGIYDKNLFPDVRFHPIGNEDYLFWLTLMRDIKAPAYATPSGQALGKYRVRTSSLSGNKFRSASWQWNIYRNHLGFNIFKSALLLFFYTYNGLRKRNFLFG